MLDENNYGSRSGRLVEVYRGQKTIKGYQANFNVETIDLSNPPSEGSAVIKPRQPEPKNSQSTGSAAQQGEEN